MRRLFIVFNFSAILFCNIAHAQIFQRIDPGTIQFDIAVIGDGDGLYYVPPGECAGNYSCQITGLQNWNPLMDTEYSCEMPRDGEGRLQDFWIEIWGANSTGPFYLFCRIYEEIGLIYITRSDHSWQLELPDPEQDVLNIIPPHPIGKPVTIDFDRVTGRINVTRLPQNHIVYIIPFCETENSDDGTGNPTLRMANTGANTAPLASRTAANAGLNTGKVATPATPGLSQSLLRFPNPISASLTITWGNEAPADTELSLWSLDGRRIAQGSLGASDADYTFPTAHLPAGVYLLRVVSAGQIPQTYKIVKN